MTTWCCQRVGFGGGIFRGGLTESFLLSRTNSGPGVRAATWIEMVASSTISGEVWSIIAGAVLLACVEYMDVQ